MSLSEDFRAIREHAAIAAIAQRGQIAVSGKDRASYLQGLLTNDIQGLTPGSGCYAAWLTPQGRMLTDLHVFQSDDMLLLDVPASRTQEIVERLDQFLFGEDVQLANLATSLCGVWLHGPAAAAVLERVLDGAEGLSSWTDYQHARVEFDTAPAVVARVDQLGVPGFCVYLEPTREAALTSALVGAGGVKAMPVAVEAARIEAGYPIFDVDMTDDTIPLEAGIQGRAISLTKGCYVGQEVIIRVLHRGHGRVARKLVALRLEGAAPPRAARVLSGERDIGFITSAAQVLPAGARALGYLHRDFVLPGTRVDVATSAGPVPAVVSDPPARPAS